MESGVLLSKRSERLLFYFLSKPQSFKRTKSALLRMMAATATAAAEASSFENDDEENVKGRQLLISFGPHSSCRFSD
jgi:hypothetical protein